MAKEIDYGPRIGADPELFVTNLKDTDKIIPVCGLIGGTKSDPVIVTKDVINLYGAIDTRGSRVRRPLRGLDDPPEPRDARNDELNKGVGEFAIQEDNVMLEFNIPAYREYEHFQIALDRMLGYLDNSLISRNLAIKYGVSDHGFSREVLEANPQSLMIGCSPDMWAYAPREKRFHRDPFEAHQLGNRRYCGGHIHLQYNYHNVPRYVMAQFMDLVAALPYLRFDKQRSRRAFYGLAGLYRKKPYGIEYRTLSNFWVMPKFRTAHLAGMLGNIIQLGESANETPEKLNAMYSKIPWDDVQKAVEGEDVKKGNEIVNYIRNDLNYYINVPIRE